MLGYLLSLFELKRLKGIKTYRVFYTTISGDFFLETFIEARTAYEAAREFDQNPEFLYSRRRGMPTLA